MATRACSAASGSASSRGAGPITLAIVVVLGVALYLTVDQALAAAGHDQLSGRTSAIAPLIQNAGQRPRRSRRPIAGLRLGGSSSGTLAIVVAPDDNVIGPVGEATFPGLPVAAAVAAARGGTADYRGADPAASRSACSPRRSPRAPARPTSCR